MSDFERACIELRRAWLALLVAIGIERAVVRLNNFAKRLGL